MVCGSGCPARAACTNHSRNSVSGSTGAAPVSKPGSGESHTRRECRVEWKSSLPVSPVSPLSLVMPPG